MPIVPSRPALRRRTRTASIATAALWLLNACASGGIRPVTGVPDGDLRLLRERHLMVPVQGIEPDRVPDTFYSKRDGGRIHRATDILAPRGTPVLAADGGRVLRLSRNELGGITIYAVDPDGRFVYYYAHLEGYRKGLEEGEAIHQGELLGYVGTTGNAPENMPHLHFQIMLMGPKHHYWDGTPIDAIGFFDRTGRRR
jgi:murein DD-endopeptidase MepM/ murein hydrolase activator NlpD